MADEDLCHHTEPKNRRKSFWEWVRTAFPGNEELQDQFCHVFNWVMQKNLDRRDKGRTCPSDLPSPSEPGRYTYAPYSSAEIAAWWNDSLRIVGYDIES